LATLSVLLVDDNRAFLRILTGFLSEYGEGVLRVVGSVAGGRDAVAQAQRLMPDVILLDLAMPDVSGLALLPRIREALPDAILIALTLLDPNSSREATLTAGADAFVSKMSLERELIPTIRRLASRGPRSRYARLQPPDVPPMNTQAPAPPLGATVE
jgi:two-component system invasion response regulator UvrY